MRSAFAVYPEQIRTALFLAFVVRKIGKYRAYSK